MNKETFEGLYQKSIEDENGFWGSQALELIEWDKPFTQTRSGGFGDAKWFEDGMLNVCYNCVDRHAKRDPNKVAIIYDGNDGESVRYTFEEVLKEVIKIANVLKEEGLKKGDVVALYMAMSPETVFSVLACARLGLVHNAVFGGFSAESLGLRLDDSNARMLLVQDSVRRGESVIKFLDNARKAVKGRNVSVLIFDTGNEKNVENGFEGRRVLIWSRLLLSDAFVPCVSVGAEDVLFYLYTSGSTGRPKGIVHTTGGYLVYATLTAKLCFDMREGDVFACTADIGWITGHSYVVYGPLSNGITTVVFGGTPMHPSYYRLFEVVERYGVTQLYTAPTVIRTLKKYFSEEPLVRRHDLSSLRILGSVGEPINREAYLWFRECFNGCPVVDTYWQTESGGILIAPIPHVVDGEPECACLPFLGHEVVIARAESVGNGVVEAECGELGLVLLRRAWPGMARGILGDMERFRRCYFGYKGFYFTGDEGYKDEKRHVWIRGRADDVINVSGHRLSTAEVESAACTDVCVAEAAVVAADDEITGQALCVFVVSRGDFMDGKDIAVSLRKTLRERIGRFVNPREIYVCKALPKTATGKIMRRVLRDALVGDLSGDLSTCTNTDAIEEIRSVVAAGGC